MANTTRPFGLRPVSMLTGAPWNGVVEQVLCPSSDGTAVYVGDPVKSSGTAAAAGTVVNGQDCAGMLTVVRCAAGDAVRGVIVGFLPKQSDLTVLHREASTNRIGLMVSAPDVVYEIEVNGSAGLAVGDVGANADIVATAGSATTGQSAVVLDQTTINTTLTLAFRIIGLVKRPDNELGQYAHALVTINKHELYSPAGRVGV